MIVEHFIEIIPNIKEKRIPLVKLTKSQIGQIGTATFIFIKPNSFNRAFAFRSNMNSVKLMLKKNEIFSKKIKIVFKNGNPFILKSLFIFNNKNDYFYLLSFINLYVQQKKLSYLKTFIK